MEITTETPTSTLEAIERRAGWEPAEIRRQAMIAETGGGVWDALPVDLRTSVAAQMRAKADRIAAEGAEATAELDRRTAEAPARPWKYLA